ncbi:helix-turn-helix transcriptional regulator [Salinibacterium soli]|uniref:YafY family protein n=1 Tax=Antiquaquibacter soli TaxID=3064523 RepID=A0ABT9BMZ4_9MICO|nr:YafY family protein [Protaetiibacter sp. WY-16]MDO7882403.1 YafY family protein [Protaetiibacter sp. WY-16]
MSETTTASRILSLLSLLQTHRHWAGAELAERLGVTDRTLRRDIERLRDLGYRIESVPGAGGGYRLEAGAAMPPLLLTDVEAVTMAVGLRVAATQGLVDGELTTLTALAKLEQVLPSALRERVNALSAAVSTTRLDRPVVSPEILGQLALACRDRERIRFHYVDGAGVESRRSVEPHSLVPAGRHWFLVAWDLQRDDWRTFRIDRVSSFLGTRLRSEPRDLPADDAAEFVRSALRGLPASHSAWIEIDMPLDAMVARFGQYSAGVERVDDGTVRWPISGASLEELAAALVWIPAGVGYRIRGNDDLAAFVAEAAERMAVSTRATPSA